MDTEKQYADNKNTLDTELSTSAIQLMNEIETWEMNFALKAPISGTVTFTSYWSENQQVTTGETVFTIVPEREGSYFKIVDDH